jgi:hypothetical protein
VDPRLGTWDDVRALADKLDLELELMVNHISPASTEFQDFLANGDASGYADMFIDWDSFWEDGEAAGGCSTSSAGPPCDMALRSCSCLVGAQLRADRWCPAVHGCQRPTACRQPTLYAVANCRRRRRLRHKWMDAGKGRCKHRRKRGPLTGVLFLYTQN